MKAKIASEIGIVSKKSSPSSEDRQYLGQLKSVNLWLDSTQKDVVAITKELQDPSKLDSVYRRVIGLKENLDKVQGLIDVYNKQTEE
jgi:hypothetical protein